MSISPLRIALVAGGGALVAAWLAAATTAPRGDVAVSALRPDVSGAGGAAQTSTAAADLAADMERLRRRLTQAPRPRLGARNPFSLAPAAPRLPDAVDPPPRLAAPAVSRRPGATRSAVELIGIAAAGTEEGSERTGILTTLGGEVLLVRDGDGVPGGYRVEAVGPSSVTLVDGSGARHRLALP